MVSNGEVNVAKKNPLLSYGTWVKKRLEGLARKTILPEVTSMHSETCLKFLASKQHRVVFQHIPPKRKSHPLELVIPICIIW